MFFFFTALCFFIFLILKGKTADAMNYTLNTQQEFKKIETGTKSAIDNAIRSAKDQADNIVLDIKADISDGDLRSAIISRVNRSENIKSIWIIKEGSVTEYKREDILKDDWNIK